MTLTVSKRGGRVSDFLSERLAVVEATCADGDTFAIQKQYACRMLVSGRERTMSFYLVRNPIVDADAWLAWEDTQGVGKVLL